GGNACAAAAGGGELVLSGTAALVGTPATWGGGKRDMRAINLRHCAAVNGGAGCGAAEGAELPRRALAGVLGLLLARRGRGRGPVAGGRAAVNAMSIRAADPASIGAPAAACKLVGLTTCCGLTVRGSASSRRTASAANESRPCWSRIGTRLNAEIATALPLACCDLVAGVAVLPRPHRSAETVG